MTPISVSGAVEGPSDEHVLRRIVEAKGGLVHRVQVPQGKSNLRSRLPGYNASAQRQPWLVLVDLNGSHPCPASLVQDWLPAPSHFMRFRVVVRSIESWLLADRERFASFFGVAASRVPPSPDDLSNPRQALLATVAWSRRRAVREDMLPRPGSGRSVGSAYTSRLIEYTSNAGIGWRPDEASTRSPSLARCLERLEELTRQPGH
jgi:hypothetical protein